MDDWGRNIEAVADALLGEPTSRKSNELRYGQRGSLCVKLDSGFWDDYESGEGGGTLALIKREKGLEPKEAIEWMKSELKLDIENKRPQRSEARPSQPKPAPPKDRPKLVKTYDYEAGGGELLFQVCRMAPKNFLQRRKPRAEDPPEDIKGGWIWKRDGIVQVPYRLPELIEAIGDERTVLIVEGEKDADNLLAQGVPATCNAAGAGKWPDELTAYFRGADVVILPDNDPQSVNSKGELAWHPDSRPKLPGQDHAKLVAAKLDGVANSVRILPLPGLPPKGDVTDWIEAGGTSEALYKAVKEAMSPVEYQAYLDGIFKPKAFISRFGAVIWGEPRTSRQKYEYIIKGLIPRHETVLIYGPSQSGKSFLTQDFAMAVARGVPYCGRKVRRGLVVYCSPEAGTGFIDRRMPGYAAGKGIATDEYLPFICLPAKLDLFGDDKQVTDLIAEIKALVKFWKDMFPDDDVELEVVAIDTFNKSTPGMDEISGKDVGIVMKRFDRIREELNTGLWVVHHKNGAGTGPRGHTSLYAAFETAIEVGRTDEKFTYRAKDKKDKAADVRFMLVQKQREGEDSSKYEFCLKGVEIGLDDDGDKVFSCTVDWIRDSVNQAIKRPTAEQELGVALTQDRRAAYRALRRALAEFGVTPPAELGLPKSIDRVVDRKFWGQVYRTNFAEDETYENAKKQIGRANTFLVNMGIIGRNNPWVWITGKRIRGEPTRPGPIERTEANTEEDVVDNVVDAVDYFSTAAVPSDDSSPDPATGEVPDPAIINAAQPDGVPVGEPAE